MDKGTFAVTIIVLGMGGTLFVLWLLSFIIMCFKKFLPYVEEKKDER